MPKIGKLRKNAKNHVGEMRNYGKMRNQKYEKKYYTVKKHTEIFEPKILGAYKKVFHVERMGEIWA